MLSVVSKMTGHKKDLPQSASYCLQLAQSDLIYLILPELQIVYIMNWKSEYMPHKNFYIRSVQIKASEKFVNICKSLISITKNCEQGKSFSDGNSLYLDYVDNYLSV